MKTTLLKPEVLASIKDLPLIAKTVVDGFMSGFNKSTVKGPGLEFSQYRSYQPGDDLRWLDWRMLARSDRYYIRESEVETSIAVRFLIDASASMNHTHNGISKIDYARFLAASLAYLSNRYGDAIGLYVFNQGDIFSLSVSNDPQHLQRLYHQLTAIQPAGTFTNPTHYKQLLGGTNRRELLIFITDMYEPDGEIMRLLDVLPAHRHEIIVFHLMAGNELEMDFKGYSALEDLETGQTIAINAQLAKQYQETLLQRISAIRIKLLAKNITHQLLNISEPLDKALHNFLVQRNKA